MILKDVRKNKIESFFIISIFITVIMVGLYYVGIYFNFGAYSIIIAALFAFISAFVSYYNSDKIILTLNGARPATIEQDQLLSTILDNLCIASGLPRPKLYVIEDSAPNAFATGRNPEHAVICFTTGLIEKLDKYELEGVMAHELSHIKNYDILLSTVVTVFVGLVVILSDFTFRMMIGGSKDSDSKGSAIISIIAIVFLILSPVFSTLMQLAISRKREYLADASAVEITRNPKGLQSALTKLSLDTEKLEAANKSTAHMYIVNPFKGKDISGFFSTHPPLEKRIERLTNIS
ncbi:MAG: M48 family metallopeptidase [Clostridia bacterium]